MERKYKVICIKDCEYNPFANTYRFKEGHIYNCKYESNIAVDDYMEVYTDNNHFTNAYGNPNLQELQSHFIELKKFLALNYYKKKINIFKIIISKITKFKFEDKYKKTNYKYKNINEILVFKIYKMILIIHTLENSEFYIYHQDKIKYILDSLIEIYKVSNKEDFNKHLKDCICLLNKITKAINIAENKVKEQDNKNKKQIILKYNQKKQKLFKMWDIELNDLWEVK